MVNKIKAKQEAPDSAQLRATQQRNVKNSSPAVKTQQEQDKPEPSIFNSATRQGSNQVQSYLTVQSAREDFSKSLTADQKKNLKQIRSGDVSPQKAAALRAEVKASYTPDQQANRTALTEANNNFSANFTNNNQQQRWTQKFKANERQESAVANVFTEGNVQDYQKFKEAKSDYNDSLNDRQETLQARISQARENGAPQAQLSNLRQKFNSTLSSEQQKLQQDFTSSRRDFNNNFTLASGADRKAFQETYQEVRASIQNPSQQNAKRVIDRFNGGGDGGQGQPEGSGVNMDGLGRAIGRAASAVGRGIGAVADGIGRAVDAFGNAIGDVAEGVGRGIGAVANGVGRAVDAVGNAIGDVAEGVGRGIGAVADGIGRGFDAVGRTIDSISRSVFGGGRRGSDSANSSDGRSSADNESSGGFGGGGLGGNSSGRSGIGGANSADGRSDGGVGAGGSVA